MSRLLNNKTKRLVPYTPGEQPKDAQYVKLNTNESPFPPSEKAVKYAQAELDRLMLYSDPDCTPLVKKAAEVFGVAEDELLFTNGSDEILNFAFMAFCDEERPVAFPDITYGFYPVFAELNGVPYEEIPLDKDFKVNVEDYISIGKNIFLANPNAPTGIALGLDEIESIVKSNPDNLVVIDEAYVDFGAESAIGHIKKYDNLLVTRTFSKSRSMAGARLCFGIACRELIADLNTVKYSTNPYNVNRVTMAAGTGSLCDEEYTLKNLEIIKENRELTVCELEKLGFKVLPSKANFVFACHPFFDGERLYKLLKENGVLIRHFNKQRIKNFNRITIGTKEQMQTLTNKIKTIFTSEGLI